MEQLHPSPHIFPNPASNTFINPPLSPSPPRTMSTSSGPIESSGVHPASCRPMKVFKGQKKVNSVAYFPDGRRIARSSSDKTVVIWDIASDKQDGQRLQHESGVRWIAISPNGRRIASAIEKRVVVWDALTLEVVHELDDAGVFRLAYSPDGRWIATARWANESVVRLWDADTGRPGRLEALKCDDGVVCVAFSPDGTQIAVGLWDGCIQVIDISTGESVVGPIEGHTRYVRSIVYSPDGRHLVTGSDDENGIRVWDSNTGVQVGNAMGHGNGVIRCISITADGRRIVSGGRDVRVWDLETRLQVGDSVDAAHGAVLSVAFSPDGQHIISGGDHGVVSLWDTESFATQGSSFSNQNPPVGILCVSFLSANIPCFH
ncbi:WD40 repeat-like protein [Leucogyrophana mollusca]|uniref:WD40 repeat-like protein n=1 Tax=Leucogyrophana mollusca TaxID=85980 RepID=A0ACB8BDE6_9AGAM|nr:WD40 repeat-like protein [Leucogyrophana mollusca]